MNPSQFSPRAILSRAVVWGLFLIITLVFIGCSDSNDFDESYTSPSNFNVRASGVGHLNHESPHSNPLALLPDGSLLYVVNTPGDTVDVIDTKTRKIIARISVGIDPVGVAVRPDGKEVWVTNHISDSVSVIDSDPSSPTWHQVLSTIQAFDGSTKSTLFDEPVGVVFANNQKAYVALSSSNRVAVIDVETRSITSHLKITAQDPRAMEVRNNKLYVVPFESNNQTQISGCQPEDIDGELCTFDAMEHVIKDQGRAGSLSLNYVTDIVKHPDIPDRDLYVFNTDTDRLVEVVDTLGTLLYGITVDSKGRVFVAQTDARNAANGKAGTQKHGLAELENRAYLNQITKIDCSGDCGQPEFIELEPVPPLHPAPGLALSTPFAIQVSPDDRTLVVTAAGSNKLFTMDAETGNLIGRTQVGWGPRGIALETTDQGAPAKAWVYNALANSVSLVDLTNLAHPTVTKTIALADPSDPELKLGHFAFNNAEASSTETFSCASCHPDGHTDQLIWILDTPICDPDCDQIQPRLVQDIRGLRGSAPYHWDGTRGDPYGGINTANIQKSVDPNCDLDEPESCTRELLDGALRSTMCDQNNCVQNDEGKPGKLSKIERDAMAKYLLSVPYPPAPMRPYTNEMTATAKEAIHDFHFEKQCGNCHRLPFWTTTNMGGSGVDIPSWRGANDRWKNGIQNRFFLAFRVRNDRQGFPERTNFVPRELFPMIVEGSVGFPGGFGRQITLSRETARNSQTGNILAALEQAADEGGIVLQGEGLHLGRNEKFSLQYGLGNYLDRKNENNSYSRQQLIELAASGNILMTITGRLGQLADYDHPQPTLAPFELPVRPMFPGGRPAEFPELFVNEPMRVRGEHVQEGAYVLVDGRRVKGNVKCENGALPKCSDNIVIVSLDQLPKKSGMHTLQLQNPEGLFSNDFVFFVVDQPAKALSGNLISSGGTFNSRRNWRANLNNASVTWNGEADFSIYQSVRWPEWPGRIQLQHKVEIKAGVAYSICYDAKADASRYIEVNLIARREGRYRSVMGTEVYPEVGSATQGSGASLTKDYHQFRHRFESTVTASDAQLNFMLAQSDIDVQIDNVGLYEGNGCGQP